MGKSVPNLSRPLEPGASGDPDSAFRYAPEESLGYLIREAHRAFSRHMQERLASHDVTVGQWALLRILWEGDGHTQRELADRMGLMEPSAMFILNGLVNRGLIRRVQDPTDGRKRKIRLTAKGWDLKQQLLPYAKEVNSVALEGLDPEEVRRAILTLIENLQRAQSRQTDGDQDGSPRRRAKRGAK